MRVTSSVKEYVKKAVLDKVADQIAEAEAAKEAELERRNEKLAEARELCDKICDEAQAKFVKEVKSKIGLTLITKMITWDGSIVLNANRVINPKFDRNDYEETVASTLQIAKINPNKEREKTDKIIDKPDKIREAAEHAANKILFELEVGKLARKELDDILEKLEIQI